MQTRTFGRTDLKVSEFGLGCARIGGVFQNDTGGFLNLLSAAREMGINFFDTADIYSQGESETLIGRAFRGVRDRVIIASKAGYRLPAQRTVAARLKPLLRPAIRLLGIRRNRLPAAVRGALAQEFAPVYLRKAVERSLRRLHSDYLDLFQLHSPPADVIERGEWESALEALKREGKIRYYGISCDTVAAGLSALRFPGVSSLQLTLNLLEQQALDGPLPQAREKGVAFIARECLANGLLVKRAEEIDIDAYCQTPEQRTLRMDQLAQYRTLAAHSGRTLAQMAMQYVSGTEGVCVSLLGARNTTQLQGLLGKDLGGAAASAGP